MSRVANGGGISDSPGVIPGLPMTDDIDKFLDGVALLFPDSASARLSRALDNRQRNAQRWINDREDPPAHAVQFVEHQVGILQGLKPGAYDSLKAMTDGMLAAGLHPEVVAALLSRLYSDVTGQNIR